MNELGRIRPPIRPHRRVRTSDLATIPEYAVSLQFISFSPAGNGNLAQTPVCVCISSGSFFRGFTLAAEREVVEESGVRIKVTRLAGVYTDPGHIMVYPVTGEARQQFAVCFHALPVDDQPHPDVDETCEAAWIDPGQIAALPIHPSMRLRIVQALTEPDTRHAC